MATGPINYAVGMPDLTSQFSNFNVALSGYMGRDKALRDEAEKKAKDEAFASRLKEVLSSGDQRALLDLQIENPDKFEFARGAWNQLKDDEKKAQFGKLSEVRTALRTAPEVGVRMIRDHVTALENSGQDSSQFKELLRVAEIDPEAAAQSFEMLMTVADPDAVKKIYDTEGVRTKAALDAARAERDATLLPHEIAYKQAMAGKAAAETGLVGPRFALEKDRLAATEEANRIASQARADAAEDRAINTRISQIKTQTDIQRREEDQTRKFESDVKAIDNTTPKLTGQISQAKEKMSKLANVARSMVIGWTPPPPQGRAADWPPKSAMTKTARSAFGTVDSMLKTLTPEVANLEAQLETVKAQATLTALPQMSGFGALAVAEMNMLKDSMGNLSTAQTPEQVARVLDEVYARYAATVKAVEADVARLAEAKKQVLRDRDTSKAGYRAAQEAISSVTKVPTAASASAPATPAIPPGRSYAKYASQPAAPAPGAAGPAWMFE